MRVISCCAAERIILLTAPSFWLAFILTSAELAAVPTQDVAIDIVSPAVKILGPRCLAQLWLSQWKIDEALQVDTKLSVLFINVLWLDPLAALCKLIAV